MRITVWASSLMCSVLIISGCSRRETPVAASGDAQPASEDVRPAETSDEPSDLKITPASGAVEPTPEAKKDFDKQLQEAAAAARGKVSGMTFDEYERTVYREPFEGGKYVLSGDIALAERKQLEEFFTQVMKSPVGAEDSPVGGKLIMVRGPDGIWNGQRKKQLTYCVSDGFGERHDVVVDAVRDATQAWEAVAEVDFTHVSAQDASCSANNGSVIFDIRPVDVNGQYLARAFFPNEPRPSRNVLIDETAFDVEGNLTLTGILRHELGHTLGWRHEHTRPEAGTCFEDEEWTPLTAYDHLSVMHYPHCNGGGDWSLTLTERDQSGAACAYGPAAGFTIKPTLVTLPCPTPVAPPADPGAPHSQTFQNQTVAKGKEKKYGPFVAKPGTLIAVSITGAGSASGDPDLYVRLGTQEVSKDRYGCRPYLSSANETCDLTARQPQRNQARVMVRGYTDASYDLSVTFVPN